jgi:sec-independent protein translocase protein TatA
MTYGSLFAFIGPVTTPTTLIIVGLIALLLFGNRLPSVMRSLGRSVVEFKKGVNGIEEDIDEAVRSSDDRSKTKKEDLEAQA